MYRLLIVDDEEIITDGLYEVFRQLTPDHLDVCKAYSAKEALNWLSRTRIDMVLTDIRMPGMTGLELSKSIQSYWPRCRIIFLTGYSEFDYAYQAIQMPHVRYLLKTEGYAKVTQTVQEVMLELEQSSQMNALVERSHEQRDAFDFMAQGGYIRHLLQESHLLAKHPEVLTGHFNTFHIPLDPNVPVVLALGRLAYPEGSTYAQRSGMLASARIIWSSFLSEYVRSIGVLDKHEDMLWFIQMSDKKEKKFGEHFIRYLEGTLELIQEACQSSLGFTMFFTLSGASCEWDAVTAQYERLRQLQQMKIGDGAAMILTDRQDQGDPVPIKEGSRTGLQAELLESHLEAGRAEDFFQCLEEMTSSMLQRKGDVQKTIEAYYSVALVLLSCINRWRLQGQIGDYSKLMRLDEHPSMRDGFDYLHSLADRIFSVRQMDERDRTTHIIDRICGFIAGHLHEDLSLVRLAEIHFFNPSYLSRLFKQETGVNLSDYIEQCRIRRAKELLGDGEHKIREVAVSVGYEAAHSFTRFFKKATGMTPQEYREALMPL
ncbi:MULTISPECIES: response regulator transcription factor [Paenibacillus]|uniref:response regulator transcription factor n=1 Tax=Paenibacillus TaxID=44249 RepID=UPI0022B90696|nr:helix-turn-helix domain-containing protein [Paenibacillus caseinilyticus]MCZ8521305.1 response regulator [Paenibacillus caseinilyticus]